MECKDCSGTGLYIKNGLAVRCACNQELDLNRRYKTSRLPSKLLKCNFADFDLKFYPDSIYLDKTAKSYREVAKTALNAAQAFGDSFMINEKDHYGGKGLYIYGNVGSGKTYLCGAIANYLLINGKEVLFIVVPDLLDEIRASYSSDAEMSEIQVLGYAINAPVLILDDLGAHNYTEWAKNKIYSIINNRLNNERPTIINSNLNLGQIELYLGERTTSRIVEMCDIYGLFVPKDIRHIKNLERR